MIYLLDTNIVSYWMRGDEKLISKIKSHNPSELPICTVTLAEIYYGIEKSPVKKKERRKKIELIGIEIIHRQDWQQGRFESFYFLDPDQHVLEIVPEGMWD